MMWVRGSIVYFFTTYKDGSSILWKWDGTTCAEVGYAS